MKKKVYYLIKGTERRSNTEISSLQSMYEFFNYLNQMYKKPRFILEQTEDVLIIKEKSLGKWKKYIYVEE